MKIGTIFRTAIRSRFIKDVAIVLILYLVLRRFLPQEFVNAILAGLSVAIAFAVVSIYAPAVWSEGMLIKHRLDTRDYIGIGIFLSWLARLVLSGASVLTIVAGPYLGFTFNETEVFGITFAIVILAGRYHIQAPLVDYGDGRGPRRLWNWVIISLIAGLVVAAFVAGAGYAKLTGV